MKPIRNSAKAVIIENDRILLTVNKDQEGIFYLFPGGGQDKGEALRDTVIRECLEEIGYRVIPRDIANIREYIGKNHQHAEFDYDVHQVEYYITCEIDYEVRQIEATNADDMQIGIEWVELSRLDDIRLYPSKMSGQLQGRESKVCYLGDVN
ncbi:NUDIX domain-containing protein [Paenibacillus sp. N1-5-1-14]|uniref:NUDIX domain-containing protein n=1 Tax=Paenibacillus radicibacter TaxID=2972488 RepID=UPI002159B327|nr:NUDIX domain-containing protein [Paenibacillus radicibacter]MCR8644446.1 NUDIX domain-containing protein [Paenibacillus radicibacter]